MPVPSLNISPASPGRTARLAALVVLTASSIGRTQEPPPRVWYGGQTLLVDAVAVGVGVGGAATHSDTGAAVVAAGVLTFLVAPPIVHLAHGNGRRAGHDALTRVSLVVLGAAAGLAAAELAAPQCPSDGDVAPISGRCVSGSYRTYTDVFLTGLLAGALGASAVDATVYAWEPQPAPPPRVSLKSQRGGGLLRVEVAF